MYYEVKLADATLYCKGINTPSVKRQASSVKVSVTFIIGSMVTLGNGSGTDLKRQGKRHNVFQLDLAAAAAARCVHSLSLRKIYTFTVNDL